MIYTFKIPIILHSTTVLYDYVYVCKNKKKSVILQSIGIIVIKSGEASAVIYILADIFSPHNLLV